MNNIKNLEAAKELVKKYNSITIEEIEKLEEAAKEQNNILYSYGRFITNALTGFGDSNTCILCIWMIIDTCTGCIYEALTNNTCSKGINEKTYEAIRDANNTIELLTAIKERAKYLQSLIDQAESL